MTETFKGTLYALLAVAMFATLGTGFKLAVTRMSSFSVVVWIAIWATLTLFFSWFASVASERLLPNFVSAGVRYGHRAAVGISQCPAGKSFVTGCEGMNRFFQVSPGLHAATQPDVTRILRAFRISSGFCSNLFQLPINTSQEFLIAFSRAAFL